MEAELLRGMPALEMPPVPAPEPEPEPEPEFEPEPETALDVTPPPAIEPVAALDDDNDDYAEMEERVGTDVEGLRRELAARQIELERHERELDAVRQRQVQAAHALERRESELVERQQRFREQAYARNNAPAKHRVLGRCSVCESDVLDVHAYTMINCAKRHCFHAACFHNFVLVHERRCPTCLRFARERTRAGPPLDFGDSKTVRQLVDAQRTAVADYRRKCVPAAGAAAAAAAEHQPARSGLIGRLFGGWRRAQQAKDAHGAPRVPDPSDYVRGSAYNMIAAGMSCQDLVMRGVTARDILDDRRIMYDTMARAGLGVVDAYGLGLTWQHLYAEMDIASAHLWDAAVLNQVIQYYEVGIREMYAICNNNIDTLCNLRFEAEMLAKLGATFKVLVSEMGLRPAHMLHYMPFPLVQWVQLLGMQRSDLELLRRIGFTCVEVEQLNWSVIEFRNVFGREPHTALPVAREAAQPPRVVQPHHRSASPNGGTSAKPARGHIPLVRRR